MQKIREGMMVKVSGDLVETYGRYGRSSGSEMDDMRGRVFPVRRTEGKDRIILGITEDSFGFTFHPSDLTIVGDKDPEPIIFEYDIRNLDI